MSDRTSNETARAGQAKRLLVTYLTKNRTDDEAAKAARLYEIDRCYWKRAADLRTRGLIEWTGCKRKSKVTGHLRGVCELTPTGRKLAEALKKNPKLPLPRS